MNWEYDSIQPIISKLREANDLWDLQCFAKPDKEREKDIIKYLDEAKTMIIKLNIELKTSNRKAMKPLCEWYKCCSWGKMSGGYCGGKGSDRVSQFGCYEKSKVIKKGVL